MTEAKCKGCPQKMKPEDSGFGGGKSTQSTSRCAVTNRIIRRMKECPLVATAKCFQSLAKKGK